MPHRDFVQHPLLRGEGRCRVCDLAYSLFLERELDEHRAFHKRYLHACDTVGAPIPERERDQLWADGLAMQRSASLDVRVEGAEKWLLAKYHAYLFAVLLNGGPRLDLRQYFTKRLEAHLRGTFDDDVSRVMRFRYSDHPVF